jgi:cystine transport system substrate-binding protein
MKFPRTLFKRSALVVLLGLSAVAAQAQDLLDTVKKNGALKVAIEGTYPPFNFRAPDGQLDGFDVAVAKAIAAKLGVKADFVATEWSGIIAGLQAGKFDVIVNQVGITAKRKESLDISPPYVYSAPQLILRKGDKAAYKSLDELKGKKLGVALGSNYADMAKAVPGIDVKVYPGAPEYLADLAAGRIDAALNDRLMLAYLIKTSKLPLQTGAELPANQEQVGIPFRKGNPKFAKALDDAMAALRQDGTLRKLSLQWFGIDTTEPVKQ